MSSQIPKKKSQTFGWIVGGSVAAAVIILGALLVNALESGEQERNSAIPALSAGMGQPIVVGESSAANTVTIFEDFQCPFCKTFGRVFSNPIDDGVSDGTTKVEYFPVAFLGPGSSIASNAAACAADQGKFYEYHQALFGHQPDKSSGIQFTEELIFSLAKSTRMPDEDDFKQCVSKNRYGAWVESLLTTMQERKVATTPTVFVNGKLFNFETSSEADLAIALGLLSASVVPSQGSNG